MRWFIFSAIYLFALTQAQQPGNQTPEKPPALTVQVCTSKTDCKPIAGGATLDANWRWAYDKNKQNCYKGNEWLSEPCPNGKDCAANCSLDGADYEKTYGVTSTGDALKLKFITNGGPQPNFGSRLYFSFDSKYFMFKLLNQQFQFTVDVSKLPCGLNGALYFAAMDEDGGMKKFPPNKAGSLYGTGYCDAQCPQDVKWIGGKANSEGWVPSKTDPNSGTGNMGSCCPEMDVWEANSVSQAFTPHPCKSPEQEICQKEACGNEEGGRYKSPCDKDGCDFASYRWGAKDFYGPAKKVDTTKKFTVITQFITSDGTDQGKLTEIRRVYVQDGKVIQNEAVTFPGLPKPADSITDTFCDATKKFTGDVNDFKAKGGLAAMEAAFNNGMVLVMSLWDDQMASMNWLDSNYPPNKPVDGPGVARGTCNPKDGDPTNVRKMYGDSTVEFSDIKISPIDTTFVGTPAPKGKGGKGRRTCR